MKMNSGMKALFTALEANGLNHLSDVPQCLAMILEAGFVEIDGCVLLKSLVPHAQSVGLSNFPDRTGYECFVNHFHLEDYLEEKNISELQILVRATAFSKGLEEKLLRESRGHFKIIVALDGSNCSIRFHSVRPGEAWLPNDLEKFKEEAVLVVET